MDKGVECHLVVESRIAKLLLSEGGGDEVAPLNVEFSRYLFFPSFFSCTRWHDEGTEGGVTVKVVLITVCLSGALVIKSLEWRGVKMNWMVLSFPSDVPLVFVYVCVCVSD